MPSNRKRPGEDTEACKERGTPGNTNASASKAQLRRRNGQFAKQPDGNNQYLVLPRALISRLRASTLFVWSRAHSMLPTLDNAPYNVTSILWTRSSTSQFAVDLGLTRNTVLGALKELEKHQLADVYDGYFIFRSFDAWELRNAWRADFEAGRLGNVNDADQGALDTWLKDTDPRESAMVDWLPLPLHLASSPAVTAGPKIQYALYRRYCLLPGGTGWCYATRETLCGELGGKHEDELSRHLGYLRAAGWVETKRGGTGSTTRVRILKG